MRFLIALCLVSSLAFADNTETKTVDVPATNCDVRPVFSHVSSSNKCFFDEVMTGIYSLEPLRIYCASLRATCNVQLTEKPDKQ